MAAISFRNGMTWDTIPQATTRQLVDPKELQQRLSELRDQWSEAAGGDLSSVTLDLGMLFDDLANICGGFNG